MPASYPYCVATPSFPSYVFSTVSRSGYVPSSSRIPRPRACLVTASQPVFLHPHSLLPGRSPQRPSSIQVLPRFLLPPSYPSLASTYSHPSPVSPLAPYPRPPSTCPLPICLACPPPLRPAGANVLVQVHATSRLAGADVHVARLAAPFRAAPRRLPGELRRRREGMLLLCSPRGWRMLAPQAFVRGRSLCDTRGASSTRSSSLFRMARPPPAARSLPAFSATEGCACCTRGWGRARPLAFFPGRFRCVVPTSRARVLSFSGWARTAGCAQPHGPHRGGGDARAVPASS
ncbi:hypothetical protein FB451DRAFT_1413418 [Mycena latifolia]|nr:hypothetical protein FB451DRAFT_1413418 [Mycena latifolia]